MSIDAACTTSNQRWFPDSPLPSPSTLRLVAARNEQFSFQIVMRSKDATRCRVHVSATGPVGWQVKVRRVGYIPVRHHNTPIEPDRLDIDGVGNIPGYVPDPLFEEDELHLAEGETHAFWVTVVPDPLSEPGEHAIDIQVNSEDGDSVRHSVAVTTHDVTLLPRQGFSITHWFYADALMDYYGTSGFDEKFWKILPAYIRNLVDHGIDTLYVPVFTPPLDGVKRPSQLLDVTKSESGTYDFDWADVSRYIQTARDCGITRFEWCHLFTQWGAGKAIRVYEGQGHEEELHWDPETPATSEIYRGFLSQYLPALERFLNTEDLLDVSYFHVSDEPHGEEHLASYREARALLKDLAPWMPTMDALTEIAFASEGLTDMPVPSISTALDFFREGIPSWCYYCCGPRGKYLNRLLDTPLSKIAMHGLLFYRWPFQGFLHWGFNYWYECQTRNTIDPFAVQDGKAWDRAWAYGDPFMVYPGQNGPIDSIRWEVFAESLQDYRLLQALGISRDDERLAVLVDFENFPKDEDWRASFRRGIFSQLT